jgi:transcription elongation factor Elf1
MKTPNAKVTGSPALSASPNERRVMPRRKQRRNDMDLLIDDSDRLKPCPFCGAEAEIITLAGETDDPSIGAQCVQCTSSACGAASGLIYPLMDDVTDLLRERWNKRHNA